MKTTYVLGSGFSASVGLPVVANQFSEIFSLRGSYEYDDADFSRVLEAMKFLYPHNVAEIESRSFPPFEEFLSLTYISEDFARSGESLGFFSEGWWNEAYKSSLRLLTTLIYPKIPLFYS